MSGSGSGITKQMKRRWTPVRRIQILKSATNLPGTHVRLVLPTTVTTMATTTTRRNGGSMP